MAVPVDLLERCLSMNKERHTVLIVDDNQVNISLLEKILQKSGYDTLSAVSGKEALEIICAYKPDLVLLDVIMPEMDGFEVCEKLKSSPDTDDIPVIFITAKTETEALVRGFHAGAADYNNQTFPESRTACQGQDPH